MNSTETFVLQSYTGDDLLEIPVEQLGEALKNLGLELGNKSEHRGIISYSITLTEESTKVIGHVTKYNDDNIEIAFDPSSLRIDKYQTLFDKLGEHGLYLTDSDVSELDLDEDPELSKPYQDEFGVPFDTKKIIKETGEGIPPE